MTCHDARELFSARADDALSAAEQADLQAHLATCSECQREWARFEQTVTLLRGIASVHAPAGFVDRVVAARPRPWYTRLARGLFVPWPVKLPLEAAAILMVAGLAIMIVQRTPGFQPAAHFNEAPPPVSAPVAPSETQLSLHPENIAPSKAAPVPESRQDARDKGIAPRSRDQAPAAAEPQSDLMRNVPGQREKKRDLATGNTLGTVAPAPAPPPPAPATVSPAPAAPPRAAAESMAKQATPERRGATGLFPSDAGLEARLAVKDRASVEATVRDLVARAGGRVVSRPDVSQGVGVVPQPADATAPVLFLIVPADRWDEVRRGLEGLGTLRVTGEKAENAAQLVITLRLER